MSAQEREALIDLLTEVADDQFAGRLRGGYIPETADRLLAAGWTRPVPDGDAIERAAEDAIADEIHNRLDEFVSWAEDTDDASGYHVLNDVPVSEVALVARRALAAANLLASPVREPGRSEAEALREHREDWANWIESQGQYVGTTEMTRAEIVEALRSGVVPFGRAMQGAAQVTDTEGSKR